MNLSIVKLLCCYDICTTVESSNSLSISPISSQLVYDESHGGIYSPRMIMRCNPSETGVYRTSCRVSSLAGQDSHVLQNLRLTIIEHVKFLREIHGSQSSSYTFFLLQRNNCLSFIFPEIDLSFVLLCLWYVQVEKFKCLLKSSVLSQHQGMNTYVCLL
ncbi:unnamed protein product [Brassica oleracea]